jgi:transcriptional regulator with XRE-family HTH domain
MGMSAIHELGNALRARRTEMGLSQARVAALSGLSRQTVNQIETGAAPDLGLNKAERLAAVLGLMLRIDGGRQRRNPRARMSPLVRAAATASVSYKTRIAPTTLKRILARGQMSERYIPYISSLLDDAPASLLAAVAEQLDEEANLSRATVWNNYRTLARRVKSQRPIWE